MKCNVGKTEQFVRIVIGTVIILLGISFKSWWGLIGLLGIITGFIRYCPANDILGSQPAKFRKKNSYHGT